MMLSQLSAINWLTVLGSGFAAIAPMLIPAIPAPFNLVASGLITLVSSYFHLNATSPADAKKLGLTK
jgi:hypothetical protein